jgi:hypothetical protein
VLMVGRPKKIGKITNSPMATVWFEIPAVDHRDRRPGWISPSRQAAISLRSGITS